MPADEAVSREGRSDSGRDGPGDMEEYLEEYLARLQRLAQHVWVHFKQDRCHEEAASLAYTSLLALVPLLAVTFGIVAAFPIFSEWSREFQSYLFTNLIPGAGEQVEDYLTSFLGSVSELTVPGTIALILTALVLMIRIEVAFNRIWRVGKPRSLTNRIVVYWSVLTLAPILIGAAVALSARVVFGNVQFEAGVPPVIVHVGTFLLSWMVFALIFVLVPNRRVRFRDALVGALLSAILFEIAKFGFVAYVSNANYAVIYGALATVPIFLLWLYLVWVVLLLGASLSASLTTFRDRPRADGDWPPGGEFQMAFRLVGHLWQAQRKGSRCEHEKLLELEPRIGERRMIQILQSLETVDIVASDDDGDWLLARDPAELKLSEIYRCSHFHLPHPANDIVPVENGWDEVFASLVEKVHEEGFGPMDRPVRELYLAGEEE